MNRVNRAYREIQDDNAALAEDLLHGCDTKRRGWDWNYVERLCNSERRVINVGTTSVNAVAFSPDGTWAVSGSGAPRLRDFSDVATTLVVWDVKSGQQRKTWTGAKGIVKSVALARSLLRIATAQMRRATRPITVYSGSMPFEKKKDRLSWARSSDAHAARQIGLT